jgi:uncharacterized protein YndB with AHSA1/START domain
MTVTRPLGTLRMDGDRVTLTYRRRLPYPPDVVWAALTEPDQRAEWYGPTTIDPREGGGIEFVPQGPPAPVAQKRVTGQILVWDPPRVFEHSFRNGIVPDSVVRYELEADGEHTVLTYTHTGLDAGNAGGWRPGGDAYLDRLEARLAGAEPPNWSQRYAEVAELYA